MNTYRALTFSEASFVRPSSREVIGTSFALRGTIDTAAWRTAFAAVLDEYPVLAARIVTIGETPHFAPGDPAVAAAIGFRTVDARWSGYDLAPPQFVGTDQLAALHITGTGDSHRLTLWASHAATDGSGIIAIAARLFELYTALAIGATPIVRSAHDFPAAPHLVMAARGHHPGEVDYEERLEGTTWHGAIPDATATGAQSRSTEESADDALRIRFGSSQTAALASAARAGGFSLHALVSGLIARAELAECGNGSAVALLTPVDFRARIEPPIPLRSVTALCGFSYVAVSDAPVETIARTVAHQIRSDVRDGTVVRTSVSPMPDPATRRHGPPVLISNLGEVPAVQTPGSLEVVDFHSQIVRSATGIRQYVESWEGEGTPPVPLGSSYLISTFAGRLSIEMRVLPTTLDRTIRARILNRIDAQADAVLDLGTAA